MVCSGAYDKALMFGSDNNSTMAFTMIINKKENEARTCVENEQVSVSEDSRVYLWIFQEGFFFST